VAPLLYFALAFKAACRSLQIKGRNFCDFPALPFREAGMPGRRFGIAKKTAAEIGVNIQLREKHFQPG
jgi:hypothetical protein